jgi:hypothetical protein
MVRIRVLRGNVKLSTNTEFNGLQLSEGGDFEALPVNQAETLIEAQSLI